jgi:hypothetical protein
VVIGAAIDLARMLKISKAPARGTYELDERKPGQLEAAIRNVVG